MEFEYKKGIQCHNQHTLKTLAARGSFSKSISKGSISTSIRSCSKSKSMSLSFSKDDRGGAPLDNENSLNIAKQTHQGNTQIRKTLSSLGNLNAAHAISSFAPASEGESPHKSRYYYCKCKIDQNGSESTYLNSKKAELIQ